jgi:hypothetical protein
MQKNPQASTEFIFGKIYYLNNLIHLISPEATGITNAKNQPVISHASPFETYLFKSKFQAAIVS